MSGSIEQDLDNEVMDGIAHGQGSSQVDELGASGWHSPGALRAGEVSPYQES